MILVFLGPPGSGKGTQAKRLAAARGWPQLSTGDMLRSAIAAGSALGTQAKGFMDRGALVPDEVVIGLIQERSQKPDCETGFILDGFPRTIPQAQALDLMLHEQGRELDSVVLFSIEDSQLVSRLSGRRTCSKCGSMFHIKNLKPKVDGICDQCGSPLVQRDDDQESVVLKRLSVYHAQTSPLVGYYRGQRKLTEIDASESPDAVFESLNRAGVPAGAK